MRISAFNRSCERKQSRIYPNRSLKKVAIRFDHDPILFSTANPADEVFGRHRYNRNLLAPTLWALWLRCLMLRNSLGALERGVAFLAAILVGRHGAAPKGRARRQPERKRSGCAFLS